jgi:hypothetical protein
MDCYDERLDSYDEWKETYERHKKNKERYKKEKLEEDRQARHKKIKEQPIRYFIFENLGAAFLGIYTGLLIYFCYLEIIQSNLPDLNRWVSRGV